MPKQLIVVTFVVTLGKLIGGRGGFCVRVIVTVSGQIQSTLISRVLHYPQTSIHCCTNVPVLYSYL